MFSFLYNLLYYTISSLIALFFILLGIICIMLPWSPSVRTNIVDFFLENTIAISLFGVGFFVIGLTMLINFYLSSKRRYYHLKVGERSVAVDEIVIRQYLQSYWEQVFPNQEVPTRLSLRKNKIKVYADLPYVPKEERPTVCERIQNELHEIFSKTLGYTQKFLLSISFQPERK